jgi:DNA invertase Pin-like site-specific DNA recombinase
MSNTWSQPTDADTAHHRAGGRRAYNFRRRDLALLRRYRLFELFTYNHGDVNRAARMLGVSRWTIYRDMKALGIDYGGPWRKLGNANDQRLKFLASVNGRRLDRLRKKGPGGTHA